MSFSFFLCCHPVLLSEQRQIIWIYIIYICVSVSFSLSRHICIYMFAWMGRWIRTTIWQERDVRWCSSFFFPSIYLSIHQSISHIQYSNNEVTKQTRSIMKWCILKGTHLYLKHSTRKTCFLIENVSSYMCFFISPPPVPSTDIQ